MTILSSIRPRWRIVICTILAVAVFFVAEYSFASGNVLDVTFLNVGQGDAAFINFPDGRQVLIDGGPDASVLSELSEVMMPWDRTIDVVVSTHPDADHVAGLIPVLDRYRVEMVVETGIEKETTFSHDFESAVRKEGAEVVFADHEKRIVFGDEGEFDLLWPKESHRGEVIDKPNDEAIVGLLRFGETKFLFPADIERGVESRLAIAGLPKVDVLKVPHHGSKTSSSEIFLNATKPEIAVISVGKKNRYGHPTPETLERLARRNIRVFRTDQDGRVRIESDGKTVRAH